MAAKKRVVVFDFDGVIADSWELHESCWQAVLKRHGATLDQNVIHKAIGWTSLETAQVLLKELDLKLSPEALADEKSQLMLKRSQQHLPVMPGAVNAVGRLSEDFLLALTAGRKNAMVEPALQRYGLAGTFDIVLTSEDRTDGEELDDVLAKVPQRLKIKPDQCAMVDDSRNGLLAAERAGMKSVAFDSHPQYEDDYSIADAVITSLEELVPELINSVLAN